MDQLIALSRRSQVFSSLRHRNYRLLWQGSLATQTGQWMQQIAIGWLVLDLTDSPLQIGLVSFTRAVPMIGFGLFGGLLADRFDRRKTMMGTQAAVAVIAIIVASLVAAGLVQVWHLYVSSFLLGTVMSVNQPVRQSLVSDLVTRADLPNAIALNSAANNIARVSGPSLAGVLISTVGTASCFFFQALGFVLAFVASAMIVLPSQDPTETKPTMWHDLLEGLRFIKHSVPISMLITLAAVTTAFGMPFQQLMPVFARDVLQVGASGLGLLISSVGAGALVGVLIVAGVGHTGGKSKVVLACSLGMGVMLIAFASSSWFGLSLVLLFFVGACSAALNASINTLIQLIAPPHLRGRIMGAYFLTWGLLPLGTLPAGAVADVMGAPLAVTLGGVIVVLFTVAVFALAPQLRHLT